MGAFIKVRSKEGWTALMSACYNGHKDVARILIAAGLDVNAYNKVLQQSKVYLSIVEDAVIIVVIVESDLIKNVHVL